MKVEDKAAFDWTTKESLTDGPTVLAVVLAEFRDRVPYVGGFGFDFVDGQPPIVNTTVLECPGKDCGSTGGLMVYAGKTREASKFITHSSGPAEERMRKAVELEVLAEPATAGPPIVVLRIDQNGPVWVANESSCPNVVP